MSRIARTNLTRPPETLAYAFLATSWLGLRRPQRSHMPFQYPLSSLKRHYIHVLLSTGCTIPTLHSPAPICPGHSRIVARPLVYPTFIIPRAASSTQVGARYHHSKAMSRSTLHECYSHRQTSSRKLRRHCLRAGHPTSYCHLPRIYIRTAWTAPSSPYDKRTAGIDDTPKRVLAPSRS